MPVIELPASYAATKEALRALACYVISPARKADCGRIGLRPVEDGFGTPELTDGSRLLVSGAHLVHHPGRSTSITTLRNAADFVGVELSSNPGVGADVPPYTPDEPLTVDAEASRALGAWYGFGHRVLETLRSGWPVDAIGEAQLWPEHFDYAATVTLGGGQKVNVGFSPGDGFHTEPYLYVGPHDTGSLDDHYWNAPFGAVLGYRDLFASETPAPAALAFVSEGLERLSG